MSSQQTPAPNLLLTAVLLAAIFFAIDWLVLDLADAASSAVVFGALLWVWLRGTYATDRF